MRFLVKKNLVKILLPAFLVAASMATGVTGAAVLHDLTMENPIRTPPVEGKITEELDNKAKKVQITNNGEADVFLRAAFSETWTSAKGEVLPNQIKLEDGPNPVKVAVPSILDVDNKGDEADWIYNSKDGWYYYRHVLPGSKSGESEEKRKSTTMIDGVKFDNLTAAAKADERYKDADYEIHVVMEVVQASDDIKVSQDAVQKLFDMDISKLESWANGKYTATIPWPVD